MLRKGFALPLVLLMSTVVLIVLVSLLSATSTSQTGQYADHWQKLANQAAEAGTAYATACLTLSGHVQTWGSSASRPNLTPSTDCTGAATYASNQYVYSSTKYRTRFVVGNLDYSASFSAQVSSTGYLEILSPSGTVTATYSSIQKKVLTWPTDLEGTMSTSGTNRTCAIMSSRVYCWGYNRYGQLGDNKYDGTGSIDSASNIDSVIPVKVYQEPGVMEGKKIIKIFVAQHHSCALSDDSKVFCWGRNDMGQIGTGDRVDPKKPALVGGALVGKTVTDIGGTQDTSCAVADGKFYCWGRNDYGQAGTNNGSTNYYTVPTAVVAGNTATTLPTSYTATKLSTTGSRSPTMCGIANGKAYCWGPNDVGEIGDNTTTDRLLPTLVSGFGGMTVTSISQDGYPESYNQERPHVCAVADGKVYCWGENNAGQLGDNTTTDRRVPVAVVTTGPLSGKTVTSVQVGIRHSCALADGGVYCWGSGGSGQVGDGSTAVRRTPVTVLQEPGNLTASNVIAIGAGANRSCAVITDGRTFCWGLNTTGQIGDGTLINRNRPTESLFLRPVGNQYIF